MVDIETLGTEPGSVILSIGAVKFGDGENTEWHRSIDLESAVSYGLSIEGDTLNWWLDQPNFEEVIKGGDPLDKVLSDFVWFYGTADEVWANSPSFDLRIMDAAFDAVNMEAPWDYWEERDFRTLKALPGYGAVDKTKLAEHHALEDAKRQAAITEELFELYHSSVEL